MFSFAIYCSFFGSFMSVCIFSARAIRKYLQWLHFGSILSFDTLLNILTIKLRLLSRIASRLLKIPRASLSGSSERKIYTCVPFPHESTLSHMVRSCNGYVR